MIKKVISLTVSVSFLISFVFCDFAFSKDAKKLDNIEKTIENAMFIDSNYYDNNTLVVHILDSHSDAEAQKKISNIINFYDSQKPIEKIFAEGAPLGKVNLDLFKGIDDNLKKNILDRMLEDTQIGACEYFASYNNRDILFGIEDNDIYNINLKLIQDMLVLNKENENFLNNISSKIETLKKLHLSKSLREAEKAIDEQIPDSYSKIKKFLKKDTEFNEDSYSGFFIYLRTKEQSGKMNYKSAIKEVSSLNKYLSSAMSYKDYMSVNKLMNESDDKYAVAKAYTIIINNVPEAEKKFPEIMSVLRMNYLSLNMNTYDVYLQKQAFKKYIIDRFASDEEKEIFYLADMIESVKQIYSLGITRSDLLSFINSRNQIKEISLKYLSIAESNTLVYLSENKITDLVYSNNLQRDLIFFNAVKNTIESRNAEKHKNDTEEVSSIKDFSRVFVVVTGGFHLEFTDFLRENKISYLSIAPKLEKKTGRKQYIDSLNLPGKLGSKNITFEKSAFAPPLLNAVNNNENPALRGIIIKNIITAWISSAEEAGVSKEDVYKDMLNWLTESGVSIDTIKSIAEISFLADLTVSQKQEEPEEIVEVNILEDASKVLESSDEAIADDTEKEAEVNDKKAIEELISDTDEIKSRSIFSKVKDKLGIKFQHWSFPSIAAGSEVARSAKSYQDFVNTIKNLKKVNTIELEVKRNGSGFYLECSEGFTMPLDDALDAVNKFSKKKSKTEIVLKLDKSVTDESDRILSIAVNRKNKFVLVSADKDFVKSIDSSLYKNVTPAYEMPENLDAVEALEEIKEITSAGVFGINLSKDVFDSVGVYLYSKFSGKYLSLYINDKTDEPQQYSDFIFEGRNKTVLLSSNPEEHRQDKKTSLAAYRNITATPFIQLVIGVEFFASFSMLFLNGQGYDLSFLSTMFAICTPLNIIGSLVSSYLSKHFGKRNVLMANLFLHCAGDALLLFAGLSPVVLGFALGVPAMAAAGIATLLIPFLHSSLKAVGKDHKFESVYGKTRSIFWIGLAVSSIIGSWLAVTVGQTFVIAMSCVLITVLSIYSFVTTGSLKKVSEDEMTEEEKEFANLKEGKKIWQGIKTVFTTKGLNTTVILNFIVDSVLFVLLALGIQPMLNDSGLSIALLGVVAFSANIVQSIASKFANKTSSIVNSAFKRTLYFAALTALVVGFVVFNNPVLLIAFYVLANFWQGVSSIIEPAKVEEKLPDDVSPYWFSAKAMINSGLASGIQLLLAVAFKVFSVDVILLAVVGVITFASALLGAVFKDKLKKGKSPEKGLRNTQYTRQLLSAA